MSACPGWERLAATAEWTDDERAHIASCARCASFVAEYHSFLSGDDALPPAEKLDADRRLADFIGAQVDRDAGVAMPRRAMPTPGLFERWSLWFGAPPARWAMSFAALALVAGVIYTSRVPELRVGDAQRGAQRGAAVQEFSASVSPAQGGAVHVTWPIVPLADGYRVEVLATDLAVVESFEASAAHEWQFDRASVSSGAFVRVVAMRMGDRLSETAPAPLPGR